MKLIKPTYEIWNQEEGLEGIFKQVERAGRVCYASDPIEGKAKDFVDRMIKSGHGAMLEHGTVYLSFYVNHGVNNHLHTKYKDNKFSRISQANCGRTGITIYVTTNLRVLVENDWLDDLKYLCNPTKYHEKRITVKYTSNIHFYKDTTRHRVFSWAIESTRFCNYIKAKFGSSVTFSTPIWLTSEDTEEFEKDLNTIESIYFKWINRGWQPQQAAYFLIQGTKAEIVMTGFVSDYKHFFDLRALGTTGKPHPTVSELVIPLMEEFKQLKLM